MNMNQNLSYQPIYDDPDKYWFTHDLSTSSCLLALGHKLLSIERSNPRKARFIFLRSGSLRKIVEDYYADKLLLNPRLLFDSQKMLKNILYSDI